MAKGVPLPFEDVVELGLHSIPQFGMFIPSFLPHTLHEFPTLFPLGYSFRDLGT